MWKKFQELLQKKKNPPAVSINVSGVAIHVKNSPISEEPPTLTKVKETISKLKCGNAASIHGILAELLKAGGELIA